MTDGRLLATITPDYIRIFFISGMMNTGFSPDSFSSERSYTSNTLNTVPRGVVNCFISRNINIPQLI